MELLLHKEDEFTKVLVFLKNKKLVDRLYDLLEPKFPDRIGVIHSNKSQNFRINAVNRFQEGTLQVLIATDLASRGLDISDISHVINFDTPVIPEDYMHRIGRTGRVDKDGIAITFYSEVEREFLISVEQFMNKSVFQEMLPENLIRPMSF